MKLSKFLTSTHIYNLDNYDPKTHNKSQVITKAGELHYNGIKKLRSNLKPDQDLIINDMLYREELVSTGAQPGIAFPHAKTKGTPIISISVLSIPKGIDWDAFDHNPVYLAFSIVAPEDAIGAHLNVQARLSYMTKNPENRLALLDSTGVLSEIYKQDDKYNILDKMKISRRDLQKTNLILNPHIDESRLTSIIDSVD